VWLELKCRMFCGSTPHDLFGVYSTVRVRELNVAGLVFGDRC
jgi:hypothetical protein